MVHPNVVCHDAYVPIDPVTIKPPRPTFSNAGRWLIVVSVPWFFLVLLGSSALGLVGRDDPQAQRILAIIVAGAPVIVLVFHQWLGRVPGLRWLHHRIQPRLAIGANGLDLRLPDVGEHFYSWDKVGGIRTRTRGGADLLAPDGAVLARIPESMVLAGGTWWRSESVASVVVRVRPDRYRLSGANWAGVPTEFALRSPSEPITTVDQWADRRLLVNAAVAIAFVVVTGFLVVRYLTS